MKESVGYSSASATAPHKTSIWAYPLIFLVYAYRYSFSPIIGNQCRFYPTCSQYALDALHKYGAFRGSIMAARRVLRCHPWHAGGYDPVD